MNGIRTAKGGTKFIVEGSTVVRQSWTNGSNSYVVDYMYNEAGIPIAFAICKNGGAYEYYAYETNIQGDIVAVWDMNANDVVYFTYDAWGNFTVGGTKSSDADFMQAVLFRYRGYIYDAETGLYYLQTRYYDSETGRFINADGYINANGDILGYNMFAYCGNNPVMFIDATGEGWFSDLIDWINENAHFVLYDNRRFDPKSSYHEQILVIDGVIAHSGEIDKDKNTTFALMGISGDLATGGWDNKYFDLSLLDFGHFDVGAGFDGKKGNFKLSSFISIWSPSLKIKTSLFTLELGLEVGSIGSSISRQVSGSTNEFKYSGGIPGLGFTFGISWDED